MSSLTANAVKEDGEGVFLPSPDGEWAFHGQKYSKIEKIKKYIIQLFGKINPSDFDGFRRKKSFIIEL